MARRPARHPTPLAHQVLVTLAAVVALISMVLVGWGWAAEGHTASVESADLAIEDGFARFEASFKDTGAGSSKIAVWIEVYEAPGGPDGSGGSPAELARKSGKSACQAGRTCVTLLRTVVQVLPGECYVGRASTTSEGETSERQSPASGRLCP